MMTLPVFLKKKSTTLASSSLVLFALAATGCQSTPESSEAIVSQPTSSSSTSSNTDISQQILRQQALHIQQALANGDYASIANDIHPTRGVRFSMYAYVRPETDKVFSRDQFTQYLQQSNIQFTWGEKDGTGDPLVMPLPTYLDTWVNASVFNDNSTISFNSSQSIGNSINNLNKIYKNSDFVEFYSNGSEEYDGMDWRAIRLVFDEYQGKHYLVAIINDQWTI
ncbi:MULTISPECIES: hypothetical protein [unclassified Psychrobacter]|uniref:hypothetical protein n=1 Tax=unclassified Psychrobacter TaxID=196806 RepID=UPI003FB82848